MIRALQNQTSGAAAVCFYTCSTAVIRGPATIPTHYTSRLATIGDRLNKPHLILISVLWKLHDLHSLNTYKVLFVFACWQIAEEPPPVREIPPDCSSYTADVIRSGLQKDPNKRASAKELFVKTAKALKEGNNK